MSVNSGKKGQAGSDNRPLTETEYSQVQRLFSDPFSFPIEFKTWLVSYLEASDMVIPMSSVSGLSDALASSKESS